VSHDRLTGQGDEPAEARSASIGGRFVRHTRRSEAVATQLEHAGDHDGDDAVREAGGASARNASMVVARRRIPSRVCATVWTAPRRLPRILFRHLQRVAQGASSGP
jgi:hypothetical protein